MHGCHRLSLFASRLDSVVLPDLILLDHGVEDDEEFSHDGYEGEFLRFAAIDR